MDGKMQFQERLAELVRLCQAQGNAIEKSEVERFFEKEALSEEQMILVFDYLLAQKIMVKRYMKQEELLTEETQIELTAEEREYLQLYEQDLLALRGTDLLTKMLPEVVAIAKERNHQEVFIGDLIQEGNMALMTAIGEGIEEREVLLRKVQEQMQVFLESQTEVKRQDQKMAEKVNRLEEEIKKLTEEMGRKITIEELSELAEISEEEIEDILRMAGEEVGEIEEEEL